MSDLSWLTQRPIAHRGFHDMNNLVWENTMSAFSLAADAGFAIECDLHYASDGVPVIFHDDTLDRVCSIPGKVREKTSAELGLLSIGGTKDRIPKLAHLLDLAAGRVPLVLELKGKKEDDEGFAESVLETLEGYDGHIALMSFDVWLLEELKALGAPYPVGLTAFGDQPEILEQHKKAMALGLDFTSYYVEHLPNPFISGLRAHGVPVITWTVRNKEAVEKTFANADQMTFEGFDPRTENLIA